MWFGHGSDWAAVLGMITDMDRIWYLVHGRVIAGSAWWFDYCGIDLEYGICFVMDSF